MKKLKSVGLKIIEILYEVLVWYIFLITGAMSVAIMYMIPKFGVIVLLTSLGLVISIRFNQYLKFKKRSNL